MSVAGDIEANDNSAQSQLQRLRASIASNLYKYTFDIVAEGRCEIGMQRACVLI